MDLVYMVAREPYIACVDSGYISVAKDDIVFVARARRGQDREFEYVQRLHSDQVGWVPLSVLSPVVLSPILPYFHLTFAINGDSLMCQLITDASTSLADVSWSGVSFAGWSPAYRRPHISLNELAPDWDAAYLELLISDLAILYFAKTGRQLCFAGEVHHGKYWYTSRDPIIILTDLGVRQVDTAQQSGDRLVYFEPQSQLIRQWRCLLLLLGQVACSRNFPRLRMRDLALLHLTCAVYRAPPA